MNFLDRPRTIRRNHYLTVQSFKTGSQFLIEIQLPSASALQSAEPPVKNQLARVHCYCLSSGRLEQREDTTQNTYDNSLHVVPVKKPEGQFY
jgi:hypothetical protein